VVLSPSGTSLMREKTVNASHKRFAFVRSTVGRGANLTRRSFLKCTSLTAMGYVLAGESSVAWTAAAQAQDGQYPVELGRGYLSTGRITRVPISDLPTSSPQWSPQGVHQWDIELVDSHSTYEERVAESARIDFAGGVAGGGLQGSASKNFRSEKNAVHLIAWKKVVLGDFTLTNPVATPDAASETSPWNFVRRFGDQFIDKVTLGGELAIVYALKFETETEAREFSVKASGHYKLLSGGAELHRSIVSDSMGAEVSLRGFCSGVTTMPSMIGQGTIANPNSSDVPSLLQFWDRFDNLVTRDGAAPVGFRLNRVENVRGVRVSLEPPNSLQRYDKTLRDCEAVADEIDQRRVALRYLRDKCLDWNTHVNLSDVTKKDSVLKDCEDKLRDWMEPRLQLYNVNSFDDPFRPPIHLSDLPTIPENWICRDLVQAPNWNLKYTGANTAVREAQKLPSQLIAGQHIQIRGKLTKYTGPFVNGVLQFDTGGVIKSWGTVSNQGINVAEIVRVPDGAQSVILTGTAYGGGPLVVDLTLWD
jgi:hypothetical protein